MCIFVGISASGCSFNASVKQPLAPVNKWRSTDEDLKKADAASSARCSAKQPPRQKCHLRAIAQKTTIPLCKEKRTGHESPIYESGFRIV
jgi:hypothetical protein